MAGSEPKAIRISDVEYLREIVFELRDTVLDLSRNIAQFKDQNLALSRRLDLLESRKEGPEVPPSQDATNKRNVGLSYNLRYRLEDLKLEGKGWDFSKPFHDHQNQMVANELVRFVHGLNAYKNLERVFITQKIKTIFKNQRDAHCRTVDKVADLLQSKMLNTRRRKKLEKRLLQLGRFQQDMEQEFGFGCQSLLQSNLMSDDEDLLDEDGLKVGINVLRPSWRSDKANAFFDKLQKLEIKEKGRDVRQLSRTFGTVEKSLPLGTSDLPDWALKSHDGD